MWCFPFIYTRFQRHTVFNTIAGSPGPAESKVQVEPFPPFLCLLERRGVGESNHAQATLTTNGFSPNRPLVTKIVIQSQFAKSALDLLDLLLRHPSLWPAFDFHVEAEIGPNAQFC